MVYQGTVHNGVIVFEPGVQLPKGVPVRVEVLNEVPTLEERSPKDDILFQMPELAMPTDIPDLAVNIDHYLYGHPKVTDE